jgi:outer membrane protein TolC
MRKLLALLLPALLLAQARADTLRLSVDDAVRLALQNNRQIALAQARLDEAAAGKGVAFGSFLPQVSGTGTYTRLARASELTTYAAHDSIMAVPVFDTAGNYIGSTGVPVRVPVGLDTYKLRLGSVNNYSLGVTAQQTLFTWGKLANAYRIAGLTADMQRAALRQARMQVKVDATSGFYQALLATKTAALMRDSRDQLRRHVDQVQSLYDNGLATRLDVMKATLGLTNLEAQVGQVENGAALALAALHMTLGLADDRPLALSGELQPETLTVDLAAATDSALASRPELVQLRDALGMSVLGRRIAGTANLPNAFAQFNFSYANPVGFSSEWGSNWNATVGVSWPLFTGLANCSKLRQADARVRQARVAFASVEDGIRLEVQSQVLALNQEARNADCQARSVEVAEQALALAEQRYQNGLLTNLEYMDTQLALTQSRLSYLNALANYQIAEARLHKALGAE